MLGPTLGNYEGEARGMTLSIRYVSSEVPDDVYYYSAAVRRVFRNSQASRGGTMKGGVDFDSWWGFNGKPNVWTFRVLADKEILAVVHSSKYADRSVWCAPRDGQHGVLAALPCVPWEKRRVWVVEGTPPGNSGQYDYAKRLLYIDQDFFGVVVSEMYDQQGELRKTAVNCLLYTSAPYAGYPAHPVAGGKYHYEDAWPFVPNGVMVDLQAGQVATVEAPPSAPTSSEWRQDWYFNEPVPSNTPEIQSLSYFMRIR